MGRIAIFSDLDGCLLNKHDYSFDAALPVLKRLGSAGISVVMASSKTEVEMRRLGEEMQLEDAPMICENGGVIFWSRDPQEADNRTVLGVERSTILHVLRTLKTQFQFASFEDLGVDGVASATDLPPEKAAAAVMRTATEPLLWQDDEDAIEVFRERIEAAGLTLTKGGRFWHVAGPTTKGLAMQRVLEHWLRQSSAALQTIAVGDSPIDQSMLDIADFPIAIPQPNGLVLVNVAGQNSRTAKIPGVAGWADKVSEVLNELGVPA